MSTEELDRRDRVSGYIDLWKQTVEVQKHFNDLEWRIRGLALTALTFTVGAAGLAAGRDDRVGPISLGATVTVIGLILWYAFYFVDRYWYHPLLKAAVKQGEHIEELLSTDLPGADLTKQISLGSPQRWKPLGIGRRGEGGGFLLRSTQKMAVFYGIGATTLIVLAAALQVGSWLAHDASGCEATPETSATASGPSVTESAASGPFASQAPSPSPSATDVAFSASYDQCASHASTSGP